MEQMGAMVRIAVAAALFGAGAGVLLQMTEEGPVPKPGSKLEPPSSTTLFTTTTSVPKEWPRLEGTALPIP